MGPGEALIAFIVIGIPMLAFSYLFHRWFKLKESGWMSKPGWRSRRLRNMPQATPSLKRASECWRKS